ncbi:MAG: alpha/beta fold hydrolase [Halobaculum sp.]
MASVDRDGVRISYEERGDPDGEPVLLLEGLGYARWMWRWQADALDGYRLLLPDNRGTGGSDAPPGPYSIDQLAADARAVVADADAERPHVVGASMGGMIALRYALDYEARSLSLFCTSPGGPDAVPTPDETLAVMFGVPDGADEREAIRYKMEPAIDALADDEETLARIVDWRVASDAPPAAREAQGAAVEAFDVSDELDRIEVPTFVAHGTADRVLPVENGHLLADRLGGESLFVEGGPHLFFVEAADRLNDRLTAFLAEASDE